MTFSLQIVDIIITNMNNSSTVISTIEDVPRLLFYDRDIHVLPDIKMGYETLYTSLVYVQCEEIRDF